jgi:glucose-1-phosphate thymidylyltransferase
MKLIIPMAGIGKRMRPHTLTVPKPLLKVAGKSIVQRIVEDIVHNTGRKVEEIHFVIGEFGEKAEESLKKIARRLNTMPYIHYQKEALGTAHAIFCAESAMDGELIIAFADTLYLGNFQIEDDCEAALWTYKVGDPSNYGVVLTNEKGEVTGFVEKPESPISRDAIVGLYYFRDSKLLRNTIDKLIRNNKRVNGEFQLTDCLEYLLKEGLTYKNKALKGWLDFGNKNKFLASIKEFLKERNSVVNEVDKTVKIVHPVWIGNNVRLNRCEIGPNVIIDSDSTIEDSKISDSSIGSESLIENSKVNNSLIGNYTVIKNFNGILNIGDYNVIE